MSNNAQTSMTANQQGAPGFFTSLDYIINSASRVAEGVVGFKLATSEANARVAENNWRAANYNALYSSQVGSNGSPWGGLGSGIIGPGGVSTAGIAGGGNLLLLGLAVVGGYLLLKD